MSLFTKVFGTYSDRQVKKIESTADKIIALSGKYAAMSDAELRQQTDVLRGRLEKGETTDDILPDAFAVVCEASERVLGMRPFRVQLIGGVVIHQGRIAEMGTHDQLMKKGGIYRRIYDLQMDAGKEGEDAERN